MEIIASAILGRSSFTFGLSRIIRFYLQVGALSIKQDLQTRPRRNEDVYAPIPKKAACPKENMPAYPPITFQATPHMANRKVRIMTCWANGGETSGKTITNASTAPPAANCFPDIARTSTAP